MCSAPVANEQGRRRYEVAFFGIALLALASYFAYASAASLYSQWRASSSFVPVTATIVSSVVERRGGRATTHGESFHPAIAYRYLVGATEFEGNRVSYFGKGHSSHESAAAVVAAFPVGAEVTAFYDPSNPAISVLDNRAPTYGALAYTVPFFALSAVTIWFGLRRRET